MGFTMSHASCDSSFPILLPPWEDKMLGSFSAGIWSDIFMEIATHFRNSGHAVTAESGPDRTLFTPIVELPEQVLHRSSCLAHVRRRM